MKKVPLLLIAFLFTFMGCVTTQNNQSLSPEGYKPQMNMFEDKDWISVSTVEFYQDNDFLFLYISYTSERDGQYSVFNPPNGNSFMAKGNIVTGEGTFLQEIEKSSLNGIEGITILLFPGDFSNESNRTGFFIKNDEIKLNLIPTIPEGLKVSAPVELGELSPEVVRDNENEEITQSILTKFDLDSIDDKISELKISVEGLVEESLSVYFSQSWTNEKNDKPVTLLDSGTSNQSLPAAYLLSVQEREKSSSVGIILYYDENSNGVFDPSMDEVLNRFLLMISPKEGYDYLLRYKTFKLEIEVEGDLDNYSNPMFLTNRMQRGAFPSKSFSITGDPIELSVMIPGEFRSYASLKSSCEIFDDLNGNGIYDYFPSEPIISNEVEFDLNNSDRSIKLTLQN